MLSISRLVVQSISRSVDLRQSWMPLKQQKAEKLTCVAGWSSAALFPFPFISVESALVMAGVLPVPVPASWLPVLCLDDVDGGLDLGWASSRPISWIRSGLFLFLLGDLFLAFSCSVEVEAKIEKWSRHIQVNFRPLKAFRNGHIVRKVTVFEKVSKGHFR